MKKGRSNSGRAPAGPNSNVAQPFPLPSAWVWTSVGDVGEVRVGLQRSPKRRRGRFMTKYLRSANVTSDGLDLKEISQMDISPSEREIYSLRPGDVLIVEGSGSPAKVGRAAIWLDDSAAWSFQNHLIRFRARAAIPGYALIVFKYFAASGAFSRIARGVGIQHIGSSRFAVMPFPLPPLPEQSRIVSEIGRRTRLAKEAEQSLLSAISRINQQVSAVLEAATFGELLPEDGSVKQLDMGAEPSAVTRVAHRDRLLPTSAARSDQAWTMKNLPPGWFWVKVEDVGEIKLGRQRSPKHQRGPNMYPYLRVANVFEDRIDSTDISRMNFSPSEQQIYRLEPGDILLNEGQSPELVGRPAMYRGTPPGVCFQNHLIRFRVGDRLEEEFALLVFRHYFRSGKFTAIARWSTNIASLGVKRFSQLPFPLPPREHQRKIVEEARRRLKASEEQRSAAETALSRLQPLRLELLTAAVSGQLVPQSPDDESASRLLAQAREPDNSTRSITVRSSEEIEMDTDAVVGSRRSLPDALIELGGRASAEDLFEACGYDRELTGDIEAFYITLRQEMPQRIRIKSEPTKAPILEVVPDAPR